MDMASTVHLRSIVTEYGYMRTVEELANMARSDGFKALSDELKRLFSDAEKADDAILARVASS